ncbi:MULTISPECIES: hypothetical protein [unclassified Microcoleus]|uniref:hypothetical protein n=1 Tax=unclassified Microcoleus TaxID=2642155 RepID=UPI002FCF062B
MSYVLRNLRSSCSNAETISPIAQIRLNIGFCGYFPCIPNGLLAYLARNHILCHVKKISF